MSTTAGPPREDDDTNTIIIGSAIAGLLLLIIIFVVVWRLCCREEHDRSTKNTHDTIPTVTSLVEENPIDPSLHVDEIKEKPNYIIEPQTTEFHPIESQTHIVNSAQTVERTPIDQPTQVVHSTQTIEHIQTDAPTKIVHSTQTIEQSHIDQPTQTDEPYPPSPPYFGSEIVETNRHTESHLFVKSSHEGQFLKSFQDPQLNHNLQTDMESYPQQNPQPQTVEHLQFIQPTQIETKESVTRSHSSPPANISYFVPPAVKSLRRAEGSLSSQRSSRQGLTNIEMVNSGATIEADHKYITRVVHSYGGYSSRPLSRSSSVQQPLNTLHHPIMEAMRNTEKLNEGGVIEAGHKYVTHVGVPVSKSYHSLPHPGLHHSRAHSFKRPIQIIMSPEEALRRKESWYRNGVRVRHKGPLAYTRSHTGSSYIGSL